MIDRQTQTKKTWMIREENEDTLFEDQQDEWVLLSDHEAYKVWLLAQIQDIKEGKFIHVQKAMDELLRRIEERK